MEKVHRLSRAVFLDRDGVINCDDGYPYKPEHIVFNPDIFSFCRKAILKGFIIVVVTNQAGVARGLYTEEDVIALHTWMKERFQEQGIDVKGFYYCPFHKDAAIDRYRIDSELRKPKPGMYVKAAEELGIDLSKSIMIGDKDSDRIQLEGFKSIIIKSRYVSENYDALDLGTLGVELFGE